MFQVTQDCRHATLRHFDHSTVKLSYKMPVGEYKTTKEQQESGYIIPLIFFLKTASSLK